MGGGAKPPVEKAMKGKDILGYSILPMKRLNEAGKGIGAAGDWLGGALSSPSAPDVELAIPAEEPVPVYATTPFDLPKASRAAPPAGYSSISDELKKKKGYKSNLFAGARGAKISEASLLRKKLGSGTKLGTT